MEELHIREMEEAAFDLLVVLKELRKAPDYGLKKTGPAYDDIKARIQIKFVDLQFLYLKEFGQTPSARGEQGRQ